MKLVIVESPAKARTIEGYLGKDYKVLASFGHVRDLPKSTLGVDTENFDVKYVVPPKAKKNVTLLTKEAKAAEEVILASDEDREGEAIAWHVKEITGIPDEKYQRIVFHEITKDAILSAIKNPRKIDSCLVDAQQGRRVLDRLVGYNLSPLLWKKVRRGLSAGRVQSVAVRLIVDREREIQAFKPEEYWEIFALLNKEKDFEAKLTKKAGENFEVKSKDVSDKVLTDVENEKFVVAKIDKKEQKRNPAAPFTTSTMQQEAARKLRFSAKKTMMLAQKLYEGIQCGIGGECVGLITYMRTDSTNLSGQAISGAREYIKKNFGDAYLPASPRIYKKKSKGAQEAHEAIRPTDLFRTPESLKNNLDTDELKLYDLIWKRTIASQMKEEVLDLTGIDFKAGEYTFRATGKQVKFDGFSKVYLEGTDETVEDKEVILPNLTEGEEVTKTGIRPEQKFTKPPARYSEATLVRALEEHGIGRPSTYAPTLSTIKDRGYVKLENRYFIPEEVGFIVNDLLVENFPEVVSIDFTAKMEEELDEVAEGCRNWKEPIKAFWGPFSKELEEKKDTIEKINMDEATEEVCEKCGRPMVIKTGRFGKFLACTGFPECKNTKAIKTTTGQKCPNCKEGDVVVKKTKRGKTFWGCSRYPDCDWASWQPPKSE